MIDETFVINMDKETTRLTDFDNMMKDWKYTRMPAINGKDLRNNISTPYRNIDVGLTNYSYTLSPQYSNVIRLRNHYLLNRNWLSPGEIGCMLSHIYLWEELVNNPNLNRIAIFEDDARTHSDSHNVLRLIEEFYSHLQKTGISEPDMLYLGKALDLCTKYEKVWNHVYRTQHPLCLHAYIITKQGARKLLADAPYDSAIDMIPIYAISKKTLEVMTFHPSLYFQDLMNNTSALRNIGPGLNITCECLVEQQHISGDTLKYLGIVIIAFLAALVLYVTYVFAWSPVFNF